MDINYITLDDAAEIEEESAAPAPPSESRVLRVALENITPLWSQAAPLVTRALRGSGTHDQEDIRRMLLGGACHLWAQWGERLEGVVISEFVTYPKGVWLRLWLAATQQDATMDDDKFHAALEMWRVHNKCRGFEVIGRIGWLRRLSGARFIGAVMRSGE